MQPLPPFILAAIMAAIPVVVTPGAITQSATVTSNTTASTAVATLTSPSISGGSLFLMGVLITSASAASVTLSITDDQSNAGWQIDAVSDPGGGSVTKTFIASCLGATTGTHVITLHATGGTITMLGTVMEISGVTARGHATSHGSAGSGQTSPVSITNAGANAGAHAITFNVFLEQEFSFAQGMSATPASGSYVQTAANQSSGSGNPYGIVGYVIDTTIQTDSISNAWTSGSGAAIAQTISTYILA